MSNALDMFRAQQEAAKQVHAQLADITTLFDQLQTQIDRIVNDRDLKKSCARNGLGSRLRNKRSLRRADGVKRKGGGTGLASPPMDRRLHVPAAVGFSRRHWRRLDGKAVCRRDRGAPPESLTRSTRGASPHDDAPAERRQLDALMKWTRDAR